MTIRPSGLLQDQLSLDDHRHFTQSQLLTCEWRKLIGGSIRDREVHFHHLPCRALKQRTARKIAFIKAILADFKPALCHFCVGSQCVRLHARYYSKHDNIPNLIQVMLTAYSGWIFRIRPFYKYSIFRLRHVGYSGIIRVLEAFFGHVHTTQSHGSL